MACLKDRLLFRWKLISGVGIVEYVQYCMNTHPEKFSAVELSYFVGFAFRSLCTSLEEFRNLQRRDLHSYPPQITLDQSHHLMFPLPLDFQRFSLLSKTFLTLYKLQSFPSWLQNNSLSSQLSLLWHLLAKAQFRLSKGITMHSVKYIQSSSPQLL